MPSQTSTLALERFTSFGDLLKFLRRRAGLTQREVSIAVGYSHAQISRLELNQRPPDLATITARFIPALDLEEEPEIAARLLELASEMRREDAPASGQTPFKGLKYFEEADADLFFGREALTARLLDRFQAALSEPPGLRFLAVVGASGSGKSSIVRAGLIPSVRWNPAFANWSIYCLTPTARPLQSLAASLTQDAGTGTTMAALATDLARDPLTLHRAGAQLLSQGKAAPMPSAQSPHLMIVIDQFEELFTLCRAEGERQAFIDNLMTAAEQPEGAVLAVLTLRADFYAHCAPYGQLRAALALRQEYIGPMNAAELRRAIEEPAQRGGWSLEPGLVEVLLRDVGADGPRAPEPGALPLLSHALLETWHRRRGRTLTHSGYLASGGVSGAIAETADVVFHDQLDEAQQAAARSIFLRLTEISDDEGTAETRRRATFEELIPNPAAGPLVRGVLTRLADARLITTDDGVAEVAHEALIREWPTLRGWLEEDRDGLRLHRHLTLAAEGWERQGRSTGELYRQPRLAQAWAWAEAHAGELTALEHAFLDASRGLAEHEEAEREAQRQRELAAAHALAETQQRSAVQLRRRALYLSGALVLALILGGIALFLGEQTRRAAVTAQFRERIAFARELAAASTNNLTVDPERSILLALQAISTTRSVDGTVLPEAEDAVHAALVASPVRQLLAGHTERVLAAGFGPDNRQVATLGEDGTTILWDAATGQELRRWPGAPGSFPPGGAVGVQRLDFSPVVMHVAASDKSVVNIWDADNGQLVTTLVGHTDFVWAVAYSADGRRLATGGVDNTVRIWDTATGELLHALTGHTNAVEGVAFSPDGARVASASDDQTAKVWSADTGELLLDKTGFSSALYTIVFTPDGTRLITTGDDGAHQWEAATGADVPGSVAGAVFSPDGARMAHVVHGASLTIADAETGEIQLTLVGHTGWINHFDFSPDGRQLVTAGLDKTARIWDIGPGAETLAVASSGIHAVYSPDGTRLATDGADGTATEWDAVTGRLLQTLRGHSSTVLGVAYSPAGERLATASVDETAGVWELASGQRRLTLTGHTIGVRDIAYSPDGTRLATAGFDGTAKLWDAATGQPLLDLIGHDSLVLGVAFSPDGKTLATSSVDTTARTWDAQTGQPRLLLESHSDGIPDIAYSPDGRWLATGSADGTVKVWDDATGAVLRTLEGHSAGVHSVAFSADARLLASASDDNTAKIWDAATGQLLHTFSNAAGVSGVAFSPQDGGAHLAVVGGGVLRAYLLRLDDLLPLAQSRVTRSLTPAECSQFLHLDSCPVLDR